MKVNHTLTLDDVKKILQESYPKTEIIKGHPLDEVGNYFAVWNIHVYDPGVENSSEAISINFFIWIGRDGTFHGDF